MMEEHFSREVMCEGVCQSSEDPAEELHLQFLMKKTTPEIRSAAGQPARAAQSRSVHSHTDTTAQRQESRLEPQSPAPRLCTADGHTD